MQRTDPVLESAVVWLGLFTLPAVFALVWELHLASAIAWALLLIALVITRSRRHDLSLACGVVVFVGSLAAGWLMAPAWATTVSRGGSWLGLAPIAPVRFADLPMAASCGAVLLAPWVEELLYRERLLAALHRHGAGIAVGVTSVLFALAHRGSWSMLAALLLGLVLASAAWLVRSTALCAGYHTGLNAFGVIRGLPDPKNACATIGAFAGLVLLVLAALTAGRARRTLAGVALATLLLPTTAAAGAMSFEAELRLEPTTAAIPAPSIEAVGVATVNGTSSSVALGTLALPGGITGSAIVPVTDPFVSVGGLVALGLDASVGAGVLGPFHPDAPLFSSQLTQALLPVAGSLRICLIFTSCGGLGLELPLLETGTQGARGVGVGGLVTAYPFSTVMLSLQGAPWTVKTATLPFTTSQGSHFAVSAVGAAHGPYSFTGSTALPGGEVQLVTPIRIAASGPAPPTPDFFGRLTVRFVPEPRSLYVLGPVALLLRLAGRRRR